MPSDAAFQLFAKALALTESFGKQEAWGDHDVYGSPLACGQWQMHPVFVDRWWPDDYQITDDTTWNDLFKACLYNFYVSLSAQAMSTTELAMWYHLHGGKGPGWDKDYALRFTHFWTQVNAA